MTAVNFAIGIHNHQPVGNFGHVFEESYERCYRPQLEILRSHPGVRIAIHHSGPLLEWIAAHKPAYFDLVGEMVSRGQVELLSGGFYEPILAAIPEDDAIGQLVMMNEYLEKHFGHAPGGMWTAERIWDPSLPKIIAAAGLKFTLLDDTHFYYAGLSAEEMFGYYVTEKHGHTTAVFPIDKNMRYSIPFRLPEDNIAYFKTLKEKGGVDCVTYGDDGEKFGVWPETYKWVFEEKWLHNFYSAIEANEDIVKTIHFSGFIEKNPAKGRIYLPMASYDEMMEWTLPPKMGIKFRALLEELANSGRREELKPFIRGGLWDNFLAKYDESNRMHKKMLHVSRKIAEAAAEPDAAKVIAKARKELYKGQCNCSYWHGLFGGLYLNYLRHAVYEHLIEAEKILDNALRKSKTWLSVERFDFDMDGGQDVVFQNPVMNAYFDPDCGGSVIELDYRPVSFALTNTLARGMEAYHEKIKSRSGDQGQDASRPVSIHDIVKLKEPGLAEALHYDIGNRRLFTERLMPEYVTLERFCREEFAELGDFKNGAFDLVEVKSGAWGAAVELVRHGSILVSGARHPLTIRKVFSMNKKDAVLKADYTITNNGIVEVEALLGVEINLTLLAGDAADRYWTGDGVKGKPRLKEAGSNTQVKTAGMRDEWAGFTVSVTSPEPFDAWRFPVETVSQSEGGFERTYQGSCIVPVRKINLSSGQTEKFTLSLVVEKN
ncbi:MAG: DUF1926 domain-containing protein [Nitrospinae bacterium]|nr:DUF1926 domain-containing protein [Nitrospinota bacterium]